MQELPPDEYPYLNTDFVESDNNDDGVANEGLFIDDENEEVDLEFINNNTDNKSLYFINNENFNSVAKGSFMKGHSVISLENELKSMSK